jgi:succinate dehydrogenase/fumarate reductase flavoprotein subunit
MKRSWDMTVDVLVAGSGYAGCMAAIAAHDAGSSALILEKLPRFGGLSILSAGGMAVSDDAEAAFQYLKRTDMGTTPDSVLRAFAQGLTEMPGILKELERHTAPGLAPMRAELNPESKIAYPFPGREHVFSMKIKPNPEWDGFPWVHGLRAGARLYKLVQDNVEARSIPLWVSAPVRRLVTEDGAVLGAVVEQLDPAGKVLRTLRIRARGGVVLATGGYEFAEDLKLQYFWGQPVYGVTGPGNTGDGIKMAQKAGADLWHMWHMHGGYGFKFPEFPYAIRHRINGPRIDRQVMPWVLLDRRGRRFMNEYEKANQDTGVRHLLAYDAETQSYPRIPCFMILDENGRESGPVGFPFYQEGEPAYTWSRDNLAEVERGWIKRGNTPAELAQQLGLPPAVVEASLERWNGLCDANRGDEDFGRLPTTMAPLRRPPFYALECWPIVTNTQGGPAHDAAQQIVDPFGDPIPGLYAAGENGSVFGHLYLEGGNLTECFVTGRTAGRNAAQAAAHSGQATVA